MNPSDPGGGEKDLQGLLKRYQECLESGHLRRNEGYFQEAILLYGEARELAERMADPEKEIRCLMLLGRVNWAAGLPEESNRLYAEALEGALNHSLEREAAECRTALEIGELYAEGKANRLARQAGKSEVIFRKAAELARRSESKEHELKCLRQLGLAQAERGDWAASLATNQAALRVARESNDRREQVKCLVNIGVFHLAGKAYTEALNRLSEGLELSRAIGELQDESICLRNMGLIMMDLGFIERALELVQAAQEVNRRSGPDYYLSQNMNSLGVALRNKAIVLGTKEDLYRAYDHLSFALELAREAGDKKTEWIALNTLGNVCLDAGKHSAALHYFQSSVRLSEGDPNPLSLMEILTNMGICLLELDRPRQAEDLFNEALALGDRSGRGQMLWEPLFHLGRCYEKTGKNEKALDCYKNSVEAIEHIRSQMVVEDFRVGFGREKYKVYQRLIGLLSDLSATGRLPLREEEAFLTVEKAKARAFLESLGDFRRNLRDGLPESLRKKERTISSRIAAIIGELSRKGLTGTEKKRLWEDLKRQEDEYVGLLSRIREETPQAADVISPLPVRLAQAQAYLPDETTAILEYFHAEDKAYLFVITKERASLLTLPALEKINSSLRPYIHLLSQSPKGKWEGGFAAVRLARDVLFPALRILPDSVDHLIIIPDGALSYLPFETLPPLVKGSASGGEFLVSRYSVSYVPSCSALLSLRREGEPPEYRKDFLAFGNPDYSPTATSRGEGRRQVAGIMKDLYEDSGFDLSPLRQSEKEIRKISRRFLKERRDIYLADAAREETLTDLPLEEYQIVHFACHAFLDDRVPFRSGLFLSMKGNEKEDGFLQAREITSLKMRAALAVLSACQTSRGYLERGEGIMGLSRVFFYSGARSVISTLWEIEDRATADFMAQFYGFLSRGENLSRALRSAKLRMLESGFSHPFYWAPFVLNGEPFTRIDFR